jgi:hypothetical protein
MLRPDPVSPAYLLVQTFPKHPPRLAEFGNILGIRQLPAGDSISRTDDIEIGRNEAFRANRIDQHPPGPLLAIWSDEIGAPLLGSTLVATQFTSNTLFRNLRKKWFKEL